MIKFCKTCNENHIVAEGNSHGYIWDLHESCKFCLTNGCRTRLQNINFPAEDMELLASYSDSQELYKEMTYLYLNNYLEYESRFLKIKKEIKESQKPPEYEQYVEDLCRKCGSSDFWLAKRYEIMHVYGSGSHETMCTCNKCGYVWHARKIRYRIKK